MARGGDERWTTPHVYDLLHLNKAFRQTGTTERTELMLALSNMAWLEKNAWKDYCEYEAQLKRAGSWPWRR